jgi:hypothetical protein
MLLAFAGPTSAQTPRMFESPHLPLQGRGHDVVLADFNGDGDLDHAATARSSTGGVGWLTVALGNGTGGFCPPVNLTAGFPGRFRAFDLNLDGLDDLVVTDMGGVVVHLAAGLGLFDPPVVASTGGGNNLDVGNMDGDVWPDVVAIGSGGLVQVLLGAGGGALAPPSVEGSVPSTSFLIELGDITGDGNTDAVIADNTTGNVTVFPGDGAGGLGTPLNYPLVPFIDGMDMGDLDNDGWLDVVGVGFAAEVAWAMNDGAGNLLPPQTAPLPANPLRVELADVDADNRLDALIGTGLISGTTAKYQLLVSFGTPLGLAPATLGFPVSFAPLEVAAGDLDADGDIDVISTGSNGHDLAVLYGTGDLQLFDAPPALPTGNGPEALALASLDTDLVREAIVACREADSLAVHQAIPGGFGSASIFATGVEPTDVAAADLNGDGNNDVVVCHAVSPDVRVRLGNGLGGLGSSTTFAAGAPAEGMALGDLDDDGSLDVVLAQDADVGVLLGTGAGAFGAATAWNAGSGGALAVAVDDLDLDGRADVLVAMSGDEAVSWLQGDGTGGFLAPVLTPLAGQVCDVAFVDLEGDGVLDAVACVRDDARLKVLAGDGSGALVDAFTYPTGQSPWRMTLGDVDSDGWTDVVVAGDGGCDVTVLLGDGVGAFGPPSRFSAGGRAKDVALTDVDVDGRIDIVTVTPLTDELNLLHNAMAPAGTWAELGVSVAGEYGSPLLTGAGTLLPGSPVTLDLTNAAEDVPAWQLLSFCFLYLPFKHGLIVPDPFPPQGVATALTTDSLGNIPLTLTWPNGVPSGVTLYAQYWIEDPAAAFGWSATRGVSATTP